MLNTKLEKSVWEIVGPCSLRYTTMANRNLLVKVYSCANIGKEEESNCCAAAPDADEA